MVRFLPSRRRRARGLTLPSQVTVMLKNVLLVLTFLVGLSTVPAHAYIDPSTGSYILQILVAGFLGAMFALKVFWHRIVAFLHNLTSRSKPGTGEPSASDPSEH